MHSLAVVDRHGANLADRNRKITGPLASSSKLGGMASLVPSLPFRGGPRGPDRCLACGKRIGSRDDAIRLRGEVRVHRSCATYEARRRRYGAERLGFPLR
jgi:hypothetical protein